MKNKRKVNFKLQYQDDLEPLFTLHKGELPMHIKYINIQMSQLVVEHHKNTRRKLCLLGTLVVFIIVVSTAVAVTLLQTYKEERQLILGLSSLNHNKTETENNDPVQTVTTIDTTSLDSTQNEFIPCVTTCRGFSAFRFKSSCVSGKCHCNSPFYNTFTCLPLVNGCVIRKTWTHSNSKPTSTSPKYTCYVKTRSTETETHVISMYGKPGRIESALSLVSSGRKDIILVLANFLPTNWIINISANLNVTKVYLISNKYLTDSDLEVKRSNSIIAVEIIKVFSKVGYGDDTFNGYTVDLLRTVNKNIGQITSFNGKQYSSEWLLNV